MNVKQYLATVDAAGCPPRPPIGTPWQEAYPQWIARGEWLLDNGWGGLADNPSIEDLGLALLPAQRERNKQSFYQTLKATEEGRRVAKTTDLIQQVKRIDEIRRDTLAERQAAIINGDDMLTALVTAQGLQQLREAMTEQVVTNLCELQGQDFGFRTDKRYGPDVVRDCVITAIINGFRVTGNEWNIIAGRFYAAQAGLMRRVKEFPGLSDLRWDLGVPHSAGGGALVPAWATWKLNGQSHEMRCEQRDGYDGRIPVKVNQGMGTDAILGKAKRKLFARILERIEGVSLDDPDEPASPQKATESPHESLAAEGEALSVEEQFELENPAK